MDIDKLEDRELDAAVAEARGMRRVEPGSFYVWPSAEVVEKLKTEYPDLLGIDYAPAPWFSTDIAAAWELVEEMRAMDAMEVYVSNQLEWDCYCTRPVGTEAYARGPTAPIAICRCYLKLKAKASD